MRTQKWLLLGMCFFYLSPSQGSFSGDIGIPRKDWYEFCENLEFISPIASGKSFPEAIIKRVKEIDPKLIIFYQNPKAFTTSWLGKKYDKTLYEECYYSNGIKGVSLPFRFYGEYAQEINEVDSKTSFNFGYWTKADIDSLAPLLYMEYYLRQCHLWRLCRESRNLPVSGEQIINDEEISIRLLKDRVDKILARAKEDIEAHGINYWQRKDQKRFLLALLVLITGLVILLMLQRIENLQEELAKGVKE